MYFREAPRVKNSDISPGLWFQTPVDQILHSKYKEVIIRFSKRYFRIFGAYTYIYKYVCVCVLSAGYLSTRKKIIPYRGLDSLGPYYKEKDVESTTFSNISPYKLGQFFLS